jgi:hypothetical protein
MSTTARRPTSRRSPPAASGATSRPDGKNTRPPARHSGAGRWSTPCARASGGPGAARAIGSESRPSSRSSARSSRPAASASPAPRPGQGQRRMGAHLHRA